MKGPGQSSLEYFSVIHHSWGNSLGGALAGNFDVLVEAIYMLWPRKAWFEAGAPFAGPEGSSHTHTQEHILDWKALLSVWGGSVFESPHRGRLEPMDAVGPSCLHLFHFVQHWWRHPGLLQFPQCHQNHHSSSEQCKPLVYMPDSGWDSRGNNREGTCSWWELLRVPGSWIPWGVYRVLCRMLHLCFINLLYFNYFVSLILLAVYFVGHWASKYLSPTYHLFMYLSLIYVYISHLCYLSIIYLSPFVYHQSPIYLCINISIICLFVYLFIYHQSTIYHLLSICLSVCLLTVYLSSISSYSSIFIYLHLSCLFTYLSQ